MINRVEKKNKSGSAFIQCCGFKDFSSPSIVQKYMGDHPVAEKKQNKLHRMKQRERGRKRGKERRAEGRRESKQEEGTTWADVPLLTHAPTCHYGIYKSAALLDAKDPWFSDLSAEDPPNFAAQMWSYIEIVCLKCIVQLQFFQPTWPPLYTYSRSLFKTWKVYTIYVAQLLFSEEITFSEEVTTPSRALPLGTVDYIGVGSPLKLMHETILWKSFCAAARLLQRHSNAYVLWSREAINARLHPLSLCVHKTVVMLVDGECLTQVRVSCKISVFPCGRVNWKDG